MAVGLHHWLHQKSLARQNSPAEAYFHQDAKSFELRASLSLSRFWQQEGKTVVGRQMLEAMVAGEDDPAAHAANTADLFRMWAEGRIKPRVSRTFPLERAHEAIKALGDRSVMGKVVVTVSTGAGISEDPLIGFRLKGAKQGDKLKVFWSDNMGESATLEGTVDLS